MSYVKMLFTPILSAVVFLTAPPLFSYEVDSDSLPRDAIAIQKLDPAPDIRSKMESLSLFAKAFSFRLFSGQGTRDDVKRLIQVLRTDPNSEQLLGFLLASVKKTDLKKELAGHLRELADACPEADFLNLTAAELLLMEKRQDEALVLLRRAFESGIRKGPYIPRENRPGERLKMSIIVKYLMLLSVLERETELRETESFLKSVPALYDSTEVASTLLLIAAGLSERAPVPFPAPAGVLIPSGAVRRRLALERAMKHFFSAMDASHGRGRITERRPLFGVLARFGQSDRLLSLVLYQLLENPADGEMLSLLADLHAAAGRVMTAARLWERLALFGGRSANEYNARAAQAYLAAFDTASAVRMLEAIQTRLPDRAEAMESEIISVLVRGGDLERALARTLARKESFERHFMEAMLRFDLGQYRDSLTAVKNADTFARLHRAAPRDLKRFLFFYAMCAEKVRDFPTLDAVSDRLLKLAPKDPEVLNFVGYTQADHNRRLDEALRLIEAAVKAAPDNTAYLDSMAWVLYRLKRYGEAKTYIQKVLEIEKENADSVILDHAGDIFLATGDLPAARQAWTNALNAVGEADPAVIREKLREHSSR